MPLPYRDVTPGLMGVRDKVRQQAKELGGVADIPAGEGIQNVPVGTMLAQIEQATKVMAAAHKGMHAAQSEEIALIVDLFRRHPEDFWRANKVAPKNFWNEQKLNRALDDCNLVPVSDPNVPSHIHRVMKAIALLQLLGQPLLAPFLSAKEVLLRCLRAIREDTAGLVVDPGPQQQQPDPKMIDAQAKLTAAQTKDQESKDKLAMVPAETQAKNAETAAKLKIADANIQKEQIIHRNDGVRAAHEMDIDRRDQALKEEQTVADIAHRAPERSLPEARHGFDVGQAKHEAGLAHAAHGLAVSVHLHEQHIDQPH